MHLPFPLDITLTEFETPFLSINIHLQPCSVCNHNLNTRPTRFQVFPHNLYLFWFTLDEHEPIKF